MTNDVLDPSALLSSIPKLLSPSSKTLKCTSDAIAVLVHAIMSALAFRLIAVDESSPHLPDDSNNVLPSDWNKNAPGHYTFRYKHNQSSLEFLIKVTSLGRRTLINTIALESDKISTLEISTDDFTSPSFFPYDLESLDKPLVHGFISSNRVADFTSQYKLAIVQKIMPGLRKEGYMEEDASTNSTGTPSSSSQPPLARPRPQVPPMGPGSSQGMRPYTDNPLEIGRRDLEPFPTNSFVPPPLFPLRSGDGMFIGPDHPIFGPRRDQRDMFGGRGPWGGDGYLPPMGAPPGARFDPVGPGPFFPGGLDPRRGGPRGGGNQTEPDNDEFMPPGAANMFL